MALGFIGRQHRKQYNGENRQHHRQQRRPGLGEGFVRRGGTGQTDDLRVDGVIAQQRGGGHGAKARDKGHDGEGKQGRHQGGEDHLPQHLKGPGAHIPGGFYGIIVNAPDGVPQKQGVVAGAGKGHGKEHRPEAGKPVFIHAGEELYQLGGDDAVAVIEEQIPGDQGHAGVDHGGHVAKSQNAGTLDVKILRQQHDGDAHDVHGDDQAHRQLQRVQHIAPHVSGEEKPDHGPGVSGAVRFDGGKDAGQGIEAGNQHKPQKQVGIQQKPDDFGDSPLVQTDGGGFHWAVASCSGG